MEITVNKKERKAAKMGLSCPRNATHIDVAAVTVTDGKRKIELGLSKYSTENDWYLDYQFDNGLPVFCHGEGSRCCMKKAAKGELLSALDLAALDD